MAWKVKLDRSRNNIKELTINSQGDISNKAGEMQEHLGLLVCDSLPGFNKVNAMDEGQGSSRTYRYEEYSLAAQITEGEIREHLKKAKNGKAAG